MNVYAVVFSVRLTESPQSYTWASVNCLPRRLSIILWTRTIKFKWDPFSRGVILYVSWGIRLHTFRLIRPDQSEYAISKRRPHYNGGIGYFVTPA